jgi:predicted RNA-binding protein with PIN domain
VVVIVVFDGAEQGRDLPSASRLRSVQVRFSEPGVEADDVIIDAVGRLPADRPVTVASSDNRVRAAVAEQGANLLSAPQLLELLRC